MNCSLASKGNRISESIKAHQGWLANFPGSLAVAGHQATVGMSRHKHKMGFSFRNHLTWEPTVFTPVETRQVSLFWGDFNPNISTSIGPST